MNTIMYVNERTGAIGRIKVGQGGFNWLISRNRLPTVAEADRKMLAAGFARLNVRGRITAAVKRKKKVAR